MKIARTHLLARLALVASVSVGLAACGGSSNNTPAEQPAPTTHDPLPAGHGLTEGRDSTIKAGETLATPTGTISCPADGMDCVIRVVKEVNGTYEATSTGGEAMFTANVAPETYDLPSGHGLTEGEPVTISAGESLPTNTGTIACPADGSDCTIMVVKAVDGSFTATSTGGEAMFTATPTPPPPPPPPPTALDRAKEALMNAQTALANLPDDATLGAQEKAQVAVRNSARALLVLQEDAPASEYKVTEKALDDAIAELATIADDQSALETSLAEDVTDAEQAVASADRADYRAIRDARRDLVDAHEALVNALLDHGSDAEDAQDALDDAQADLSRSLTDVGIAEDRLAAAQARSEALSSSATLEQQLAAQEAIRDAAKIVIDELILEDADRDTYGDVRDIHQAAIDMIESLEADILARDSGINADAATRLAKGKAYHGKLGLYVGTVTVDATSGDLTITPISNLPTGVTIQNPTTARPALEGSIPGSSTAWSGAARDNSTPSTPFTDTAMLYHNRDAAEGKAFTPTTSGLTEVSGRPGVFTIPSGTASPDIGPDVFPTGTTNYPEGSARTISGKFRGASGRYECTGATCTSLKGDSGNITLTGTWTFTPSGQIQIQDAEYVYFGWWKQVNPALKTEPLRAAPFYGEAGTATDLLTDLSGFVSGSAKYSGKAAGLFSIYDSKAETGNAGEFTADAMLEVKFAATASDSELEGTIHNFVADDPTASTWSVKLNSAGWDGTNEFNGSDVTWTIDGNESDAAGEWEARMYTDSDHAVTKGNNTPTDVVGAFHAEATSTHRMIGGFGAELTDD